jgi:hypothetical protein
MREFFGMCLILSLAACAASSGIVDEGSGTFYVSKQAATGFSGLGNLRAEVTSDARQFCVKAGKDLHVLNTSETKPPFILGNYPRVELEFSCG